jgi:hypothetical protein
LIDKPPIAMLTKLDGIDLKVEAFIAAEILKLVSVVNINGNLTIQKYQIPVIASQLVEKYPVESLEDFVLCFKRGGAGFYGTIYKLDASVLCEWMSAYLDEKYTFIEAKVKEEQQAHIEENKINYEGFKERVGDFLKTHKVTNFRENDYQKWKLENPFAWYSVEGLEPKVWAQSQEHANNAVLRMIASGELEIVEDNQEQQKSLTNKGE